MTIKYTLFQEFYYVLGKMHKRYIFDKLEKLHL